MSILPDQHPRRFRRGYDSFELGSFLDSAPRGDLADRLDFEDLAVGRGLETQGADSEIPIHIEDFSSPCAHSFDAEVELEPIPESKR